MRLSTTMSIVAPLMALPKTASLAGQTTEAFAHVSQTIRTSPTASQTAIGSAVSKPISENAMPINHTIDKSWTANDAMNATASAKHTLINRPPASKTIHQLPPANSTDTKDHGKNGNAFLYQFMKITGGCLAGALGVILCVMMGRLVTNWGWWRLRGSDPKPHYVKTWHGWIIREDSRVKPAEPKKQKTPRQFWLWERGHTRKDYEWYCWDPHGFGKQREVEIHNRSYTRKLLRWLGISKHLDCSQGLAQNLAEKGQSPQERQRQGRLHTILPPSSTRTTSVSLVQPGMASTTMMSGVLGDSQLPEFPFETVRRCKVSTTQSPARGSYSRDSSEQVGSDNSQWIPDGKDGRPDTPALLERTRKFVFASTQSLNATHSRCHTAPISAFPHSNAPTRALSERW